MRKYIRKLPDYNKMLNSALYYKGAALGALGLCTRWAVNVHGYGPQWLQVTDVDLHIDQIPHSLQGMRIAHISDLHCSRMVGDVYLQRCIDRVNQLDVDLVLLTGDYITYDPRGQFRTKVAEMLSNVESRLGSYACLGNHDYGLHAFRNRSRDKHEARLVGFIGALEDGGVTVLRNESVSLDIDGSPLWLVGLGDKKLDDFKPTEAFDGVSGDHPTIVLLHNPRSIKHLEQYPAHAVLSGHTHGRRAASPYIAPIITKNRTYHSGMHDVKGSKLYVNRGLGRHGRARFKARPEITVYTIH